MNKIVKYVCILIIVIGIYFLFSRDISYEGATSMNPGYGSNGISKKGYDGNGKAILDYDKDGKPIVGYQGNHPILGIPAPAPATNIPQLGPVGDIIGFNSDGTPIFDDMGAKTNQKLPIPPTQHQPNQQISSPTPNPTVNQSGPVKRFNF